MRDETARDYLERLQRVVVYIERHLDEELTLEEIARVAHFSPYHFHRVFQAHYGVGLARYIRRRRMQRAMSLLRGGREVTAVAMESGYDTPSAFSKAFRKMFGISPIQFQLKELEMKPDQIVQRKSIDVIYVRKLGDYQTTADKAWRVLMDYAKKHDLFGPEAAYYAIAHDSPREVAVEELRYDACMATAKKAPIEGEIKRQIIPGGTFAEFTHKGEYDRLGETFTAIYGGWYPKSGVELADAPAYCQFLNPEEMETPERLITKIYVPIKQ